MAGPTFPKIKEGKDLARWRGRLRVGAAMLGRVVGWPAHRIYDIERGRTVLTPERIKALEEALDRIANILHKDFQ